MLIPDRDRPAARIEAEALRHLARLDGSVRVRFEASPPDLPAAMAPGADPESLLLADVHRFADGLGLATALKRARAEARLVLVIGAGVAALAGTGLVAAAGLVTGTGVLNVYALLVMLVGLNGIGLVAWLLSLPFTARLSRGIASPALPPHSGLEAEAWLRRLGLAGSGLAARIAFLDASLGRSVQPWAGAALVHGFWTVALLAAAVVLVLRLAVEQVDFIWETTLLSAAHFEWLTAALGRWPSALGFPVPDAAQIALTAGGIGVAGDDPSAVAARRAWAGWLIGCTLVWGVLPRGLALAGCLLAWHHTDRRRRLPSSHPFWLHRLQRLAPGGHVLGPLGTAGQASGSGGSGVGTRSPPAAGDAAPSAMLPPERGFEAPPGRVVGLELDDAFPWPPALPPGWAAGEGTASGIEASPSAAQPSGTRLVVLASLARAPDRGLVRRLAETARAWPGPVELALVEEARALGRLASRDALVTRATDWAAAARVAGLTDCWRLAASGKAVGQDLP